MNLSWRPSPSVLVIEDDPNQLELVRLALLSLPVRITLNAVSDGDLALLQLRAMQACREADSTVLVLLDLRLPGMGGHDLLAQAAQLGLTEWLPFVVLTSADCCMERSRALRGGAREYLVKPLGYRALAQQIHQLYERWIIPALGELSKPAADVDDAVAACSESPCTPTYSTVPALASASASASRALAGLPALTGGFLDALQSAGSETRTRRSTRRKLGVPAGA